jgi:4'-phosphopantetheinyl transferase
MLIFRLPDQMSLASEQLRQNDLVVIGIDIERGLQRADARLQIRQALIKVIAAAWGLTENEIHLHAEKGQVPYAVVGGKTLERTVHLSIAHEDQYALAAICVANSIGLDVVKISDIFEWKDTAVLYLGESIAQDISTKPADQQFDIFLRAWASHEARLKCLGLGLQEWSEELEQQLQSICCEVGYVSWDCAYISALARLQSDKHNPAIL